MWISEIKITNFRPFYGEQIFSFKDDSQEKFTIIEAKSDTGKTSLLSAISWCLYGDDKKSETDQHKGNIHPFNLDRKDEMAEDEDDYLEVELTLNADGSTLPKYVITRNVSCTKNKGRMANRSYPFVTVEEWENNESRTIDNQSLCQKTINSILPENIHMFFLFEGEKLEKHFSFENQENIKFAIEKISQIEQVKSALKHLEITRNKVYSDKKEGRGNKQLESNLSEIDNLNDFIENLTEKIQLYNEQINEAEKEVDVIDGKLKEQNIDKVTEWSKARKILEQNNQSLEKRINDLQKKSKLCMLKNAPLAMCSNSLKSLINVIEESEQNNQLPPKIKNIYVKELLEKKICICGRSLLPDDEESKKAISELEKILGQNDLSDLSEKLIEGRYNIRDILRKLPNTFVEKRDEIVSDIERIQQQISSNLSEINDINKQCEGIDESEVLELNNKRQELKVNIRSQTESIGRLNATLNSKRARSTSIKRENETLAKELDNYAKIKQVSDFMDRALIMLNDINNEILTEVRSTVEQRTFESFLNLHWDKANYAGFKIGSRYNMSLVDYQNVNRITNLASGTKQVLLLSFIASLAEVSGFKFPICIDTPLANTDNEQRINIAKNLPNYLKGNQVILLVKDQEYTPDFRTTISERVSQELRMVKREGKTEVTTWD
ncbi:hypothetical protein [Methanococcoides seepicolus]|uniref:Rad50/SbcC-type AAA domain-containing protein n=1 Tax=Methanococcoides seepicolus TaxID=2828780 RepID=A0A9E4ZGN6_9EURY|nr:hypothetical protein [Methanococcoides seepicolus]MCM1986819.1 hypothetical protein [Methanococcoides seepicolus]